MTQYKESLRCDLCGAPAGRFVQPPGAERYHTICAHCLDREIQPDQLGVRYITDHYGQPGVHRPVHTSERK